jgi:hypothetical protein
MSLHNYLKGDASTSKAPGSDKSWSDTNPGPYLGVVKGNVDPTRMGRLKVHIPSLAQTQDPIEDQLITCEYLAPFYGAKGGRYAKGAGTGFEDSQHSYGMWMVPPDLETKVLVIFAEGKMEQAYWMGCVQEPYTNHMMPGIASSTNTNDALDGTFEGADAGFQQDKQSKYGSTNVPSGELNRNRQGALQNGNYESIPKPIHPFAETLLKQGLSADDIRGNTSSSARRETPSQVFGISTPGRKDTTTTKENVGAKNSGAQDYVTRKTGHTFVMDDGAVDGTNQLTRLRTASGHQILMHDTEGTVYIANGSGKAFIEMERDGTISVFSDGGINMRTKQDFNLHSDRHVNFHAKGSLNFTAEQNVNLNGGFNVQTMAKNSILNSSQGDLRSYAATQITSFTSGTQMHGAGGNIDLAGAQVHMNSQGARPGWGPSWLVPEHDHVGIRVSDGLIDIDSKKPLQGGKPNKIENSTTVSDFVTHEPYTRTSSTAIRKQYINQIMESIESENPGVSSQDLENIKTRLLSKDSIDSVSAELNKIVSVTSDKISNFASTEIKKLVGDNTKLDLSQLNSIQKLLVKPNIADISGEIRKIVGNNVNLDLSQLKNVKTKLLAHPTMAEVSGKLTDYAKNVVGLSEAVSVNLAAFNDLKNRAKNFKNEIKNMATGFIQGQISQYGQMAYKAVANSAFGTAVSGVVSSAGKAVSNFITNFKWSDSRLKEDIRLVGKSPMGINIYSFKYKQSAGTYEGVMAQEVPWARQITDTGFYMVDYSKVDVEFRRLN